MSSDRLTRLLLCAATVASVSGCTAPAPVLGTRDVCTLFDAGQLRAAVPGGSVRSQGVSAERADGSHGSCRFDDLQGVEQPGVVFTVLELDVVVTRHKDPAVVAERTANLFGSQCDHVFRGAVHHDATADVDAWCDKEERTVWEGTPVHTYAYAARRGPVVTAGLLRFTGPPDVAARRAAAQAVVRSALATA